MATSPVQAGSLLSGAHSQHHCHVLSCLTVSPGPSFLRVNEMDQICSFWKSALIVLLCSSKFSFVNGSTESSRSVHKELTVKAADLKYCKESGTCVSDESNCFPRVSRSESVRNLSCFVMLSEKSLTCSWDQIHGAEEKVTYSLIFSRDPIYSCSNIFDGLGKYNITVSETNIKNKRNLLSIPVLVEINGIIKTPRPTITSIREKNTSLVVEWSINNPEADQLRCDVCYRLTTSQHWLKNSTCVAVRNNSGRSVYTIEGLQPFTDYGVVVRCIGMNHRYWSDPSSETLAKTLENAPTKPVDVCWLVEMPRQDGHRKLTLLWKVLEGQVHEPVLGYEVHYRSRTNKSVYNTFNTTDLKTSVVLSQDAYDVWVTAYNRAGRSPFRLLNVTSPNEAQYHPLAAVPSVRGVWAASRGKDMWVEWDAGNTSFPVSEFVVEWAANGTPATTHWQRATSTTNATTLRGKLQPKTNYNISVYPIYESICGPPKSIQATLEKGALEDIGSWKVVRVTKNTVTLQRQRPARARHNSLPRIVVKLMVGGSVQSFSVGSDNNTVTLENLIPNTKYSVQVTAEDNTGEVTHFKTPLLDNKDIFTSVIPVSLIVVLGATFICLSLTVHRRYFFPVIPNPSESLVGKWLLETQHEVAPKLLELEMLSVLHVPSEGYCIQVKPLEMSLSPEASGQTQLAVQHDYIENILCPSAESPYTSP
ncbi:interleukin-31 receptor subunit alpha-like [Arapaima gigas]